MRKHQQVARQIAETVEPVNLNQQRIADLLKQHYPSWKRRWLLWFLLGILTTGLLSGLVFTNFLDALFEGLFHFL